MAIYSRSSVENIKNWRLRIKKTNALVISIKEQDNDEHIDRIYSNEPKHHLLIQNHENAGIKHLNDPKTFIKYWRLWIMFVIILMIIIQTEENIFQLHLMAWLLILLLTKNVKP